MLCARCMAHPARLPVAPIRRYAGDRAMQHAHPATRRSLCVSDQVGLRAPVARAGKAVPVVSLANLERWPRRTPHAAWKWRSLGRTQRCRPSGPVWRRWATARPTRQPSGLSGARSAPRIGQYGPTQPYMVARQIADLRLLVGVAGFEPAASSSRTKRAAKLRYTPLP